MAASPSTVITLGYGSFGSVNLVPTLGYGIGEPVVLIPIESWQCVFDESNWDNAKIEEGNWTLGMDERNWKEPE